MWVTNTDPHQMLRAESGSKEEPQKRQLVLGLVFAPMLYWERKRSRRGAGEKGVEEELAQGKMLFPRQTGRDARQPQCAAVHHSRSAYHFSLLWATFPSCFADEVRGSFLPLHLKGWKYRYVVLSLLCLSDPQRCAHLALPAGTRLPPGQGPGHVVPIPELAEAAPGGSPSADLAAPCSPAGVLCRWLALPGHRCVPHLSRV